jgi:hypothetical protein
MKQELEQHEYEDTMVMLNSMCEQYGCRAFMKDFRAGFPAMFEEMHIQINRLKPEGKVAALLR